MIEFILKLIQFSHINITFRKRYIVARFLFVLQIKIILKNKAIFRPVCNLVIIV